MKTGKNKNLCAFYCNFYQWVLNLFKCVLPVILLIESDYVFSPGFGRKAKKCPFLHNFSPFLHQNVAKSCGKHRKRRFWLVFRVRNTLNTGWNLQHADKKCRNTNAPNKNAPPNLFLEYEEYNWCTLPIPYCPLLCNTQDSPNFNFELDGNFLSKPQVFASLNRILENLHFKDSYNGIFIQSLIFFIF